ncbi:LysM peptidoglycan-binding domain-containing protein [Apilactobacillus ozensis]|uniref:aggregation-promoting factor n=1 Tax=Apilactobacillus ozensis TaxID=866801 RepID=UPI00200A62E3|nr:LysM peptidoglycan-binding domain-containing protein [Apilactobacillus ozensis]MCK8607115.1 LysM peptidoglycan-binding domain-containing protein [Apilactobacillus ozensis]
MKKFKGIKTFLVTTAAAAGLFLASGATSASADTNAYGQQTVTVQSGDTLWSIANKNNISLNALQQANNRVSNTTIYVGEKLVLPGSQQTTTAQAPQTNSQVSSNVTTQSNSQPDAQTQSNQSAYTQSSSASYGDGNSAKSWIASRESSGSYNAQNGRYYGKYQLDKSYLNGDYSAANQERVANQYVASRYGSWENAKSFWQQNGWY